MVKKYSFEEYKKSEKKLLWQDFFAYFLTTISGIFCIGLALYACWHFIIAAIAHPILFLYLGIVVIVGVIIYQTIQILLFTTGILSFVFSEVGIHLFLWFWVLIEAGLIVWAFLYQRKNLKNNLNLQ